MAPNTCVPSALAPRRDGRIPHPSLTTYPCALAWIATRPSFCIIQIGANVGNTPEDPLYRFLGEELASLSPEQRDRSKVILVEPVKACFDRLRENYAGLPCVRFEQAAVAETSDPRDFFSLNTDPAEYGYPTWLSGLGSLRPDRMTSLWDRYEKHHGEERYEELRRFYFDHRVVEQVPCMTFHELIDRHAVEAVDLLQIDAEGYDYRILRTIDFTHIRPAFINYERVLLHDDEAACRRMMTDAGYALADCGQDTLCIRSY